MVIPPRGFWRSDTWTFVGSSASAVATSSRIWTASGRKNAETNARSAALAGSSVVETALRERLEALTVELAARDQRIAQQDATISALLAQRGTAAA